MTPRTAQAVGVLTADAAAAGMLDEWLRAAGFAPRRLATGAEATEALDAVLVRWPADGELGAIKAPCVVLYERGGDVPISACPSGAEFVMLPDPNDVKSLLVWSQELIGVLRHVTTRAPTAPAPLHCPVDPQRHRREAPQLIAVGISTGGPDALRVLFRSLAAGSVLLPPIVIVQHIPGAYVADLAGRLTAQTGYRVAVAVEGLRLDVGVAYLAPGPAHLVVHANGEHLVAGSSDEPARRGHRPAAEVLFESCARLGIPGIGVVMTGMGRDGSDGLLRLRQQGWATLGQDQASCAIYGMPRAAKENGAVEHEVPLDHLGSWLMMASARRAAALR